jgi:hypothetical protein
MKNGAVMNNDNNLFVQRQLALLYDIERELIRLYAESCYSDIQAAYGNRSCMERARQLDDTLRATERRRDRLKARLRRIGVPDTAMLSPDALQRLALFEATFRRHGAAFASPCGCFDRQQLSAMLEDIASGEAGDDRLGS